MIRPILYFLFSVKCCLLFCESGSAHSSGRHLSSVPTRQKGECECCNKIFSFLLKYFSTLCGLKFEFHHPQDTASKGLCVSLWKEKLVKLQTVITLLKNKREVLTASSFSSPFSLPVKILDILWSSAENKNQCILDRKTPVSTCLGIRGWHILWSQIPGAAPTFRLSVVQLKLNGSPEV